MLSYIAYGMVWLVGFLPMRVLYILSDGMYYILYYIMGYRRRVVWENLRNSFPEKGEDELRGVERRFYRALCDTFVETYKTWHMPEKEMKRRYVFRNTALLEQYFKEGRSVLGVLGHYGNWEWMTSFALWLPSGIDFLTVYKPMHNRVFDGMMHRIRSRFGANLVAKNDVFRRIATNVREEKLFLAGFIADQTPSRGNISFRMNFLNQDTPVLFGTERIANKFNLPVISLFVRRRKRGYYEVEFVEVCNTPSEWKHGELTERYMRILEEQICRAPEYWLWSHRRWKYKRETPSPCPSSDMV